jgi:hypothetical protein
MCKTKLIEYPFILGEGIKKAPLFPKEKPHSSQSYMNKKGEKIRGILAG